MVAQFTQRPDSLINVLTVSVVEVLLVPTVLNFGLVQKG
jgi:hypothetical protein